MELPDLSRLSLASLPTDKSWSWDEGAYQVRYSMDVAVQEQLDGIEAALASYDNGNVDAFFRVDDEIAVRGQIEKTQMDPKQLLRALQEYTVQRLWDVECKLPQLELPPAAVKSLASGVDNRMREEKDGGILLEAAKWTIAIRRIPRKYVVVEDEVEDEEETEEQGEGDEAVKEVLHDEYVSIYRALEQGVAQYKEWRSQLQSALIAIEEKLAEPAGSASARRLGSAGRQMQQLASWMLQQRKALTEPSMEQVRRKPPRNFYKPRSVEAQRYMRWLKMHLMLYSENLHPSVETDVIDGKPFHATFLMPYELDGSFYSGEDGTGDETLRVRKKADDRIRAMQYDHVVPISHMRTAMLVREYGDPTQLAFNSVFAFQRENGRKLDKYLALSKIDENMRTAGIQPNAYAPDISKFNLERRMMGARAVVATYLSLLLLEYRPDGSTEPGPRTGGFYSSSDRQLQVWNLATDGQYVGARDAPNSTASEKRIRCLNYERTLALVQWHSLNQPYNPLADMAFKESSSGISRVEPHNKELWPFYTDLLFKRFKNVDSMASMLRMEANEEVTGMPGTSTQGEMSRTDRERAVRALRESRAVAHGSSPARQPRPRPYDGNSDTDGERAGRARRRSSPATTPRLRPRTTSASRPTSRAQRGTSRAQRGAQTMEVDDAP